jgi:hypothetical protein
MEMSDRTNETKTECDLLRTRVSILEAALSRIAREVEPAFQCPEVSFVTIHRIAFVARATLGPS